MVLSVDLKRRRLVGCSEYRDELMERRKIYRRVEQAIKEIDTDALENIMTASGYYLTAADMASLWIEAKNRGNLRVTEVMTFLYLALVNQRNNIDLKAAAKLLINIHETPGEVYGFFADRLYKLWHVVKADQELTEIIAHALAHRKNAEEITKGGLWDEVYRLGYKDLCQENGIKPWWKSIFSRPTKIEVVTFGG